MKKIIRISLVFLAALSGLSVSAAQPKGWEQQKNEYSDAKTIVKESDLEILTVPSFIIVNTSRQVKIQVFTILGRLVSSETLPPGVSKLSVATHGVYIVKVGELTCKVAI